ncbi:MAG: ABC transporter permease subunit, partial [Myxococcota bacterium]
MTLVVLPLGAILISSLRESAGAPLRFESLSLVHWKGVLFQSRTLEAALRSVTLAAGAGAVIATFGTAVAVLGRAGRFGRAVDTVSQWPYAVPGTVFAMALLVAFSMNFRLVLFESVSVTLLLASSSWLLLVAYAAKYLALGARNVGESLDQLDPSLAESARMSGATPWVAFRDAVLPLLMPAIVGAFVVSFMLCATELTISVLLVPPGVEVLGTLLFELQTYADPGAASVLACGFVFFVLAAFGLVHVFRPESSHG